MSKQVAICIDTPALGDTLAAIPTLRKLSQAYDSQLIVFSSKPFLFENHPLVLKALKLDDPLRYDPSIKVYRTFMPIVGKAYDLRGELVEFRSSNMDIRQFHAVSLGFSLTQDEMEIDLYIERERDLGFKDYVIIHPTHTWPTRTWDQIKWQELVDRLNDKGIPVVAVGRDSHEVGTFSVDKPVMQLDIKLGANLLNDPINDPAELRWMMNHKARAIVTMDSGLLHIAGTTDVNIIQLGSSIDPKLRAPYRKGSQDYKYKYVGGGCDIFCSSNMKYNVKEHSTIQAIPPQIYCLEGKPTFECHPSVDQTFNAVLDLYDDLPLDQNYITNNMSDKKKLLFLAPHLSTGGMPQFVLKRVEAMLKVPDYEVHLIEYTQYSNIYNVQRDQLIELLGDRFHTIGFLNTLDITERGRILMEKIEAINPDIIHIDECPESFDGFNKLDQSAMDWLYDKPWKIVETCHNIWFNSKDKVNDPDLYAFCTPYHLETFAERGGLKQVIEYPILDKWPSTLDKAKARAKLGFSINTIHVLNVGLWTQGKNQAEGVDIARIVDAQFPGQFHFHFVGNQAENFEQYWGPIMKKLPNNVTVWGERSDVDVFMSACDAFMFNSTWECSPLALREAIGHGLITFSRDLEQYKDMFTPYIVPFTNDLHENVDQLIKTLKSSEAQGKNIPLNEMQRFTQQHIEWYQQALETPRGPKLAAKTLEPRWKLEYHDGPRLTCEEAGSEELRAEFWDGTDLVYAPQNLQSGHWYKPARKWWTQWTVKIWSGDRLVHSETLSLEGRELTVEMASSSLGDTLSFMGQLHTVIDTHKLSRLYVKTHKPWLFDKQWYSKQGIDIIDWSVPNRGAVITIGVFYTMEEPWKRDEHKYDWRQVPLGKIASDRLGTQYREQRPKLAPEFYAHQAPHDARTQSIVIATHSTAQAKYWNNPTGWQEVVDWCNQNSIKVLHASKEGTKLTGVEQLPEPLETVAEAINNADLFIGISSGLSWLAWALGKKVILISGFTDPYVEFETATYINNHQACHGCWGWDAFDKGDWNWCPLWKGTQRQFECTKTIGSDRVIEAIIKQVYG
jgi:autotransporter strand-loop-strand O-heptosyltransferase